MEKPDTEKFHVVGNNLALDFVNTLEAADGEPFELLKGKSDLLMWVVRVGILDESKAKRLLAEWGEGGEEFFAQALSFRAMLYKMFDGLRQGKSVTPPALATLNEIMNQSKRRVEVQRTTEGFEKRFEMDHRKPQQLLASIAEAAADLLCYGNFEYLRKCNNEACVLLFYDTTKNHRRRWCSMAGCGNRAKAAAFYRRNKVR